jgi:hypothetical protein
MYRRPRFLTELHAIQEEMARECDYDVELFAEMIRRGSPPTQGPTRVIRGQKVATPGREQNKKDNKKN